MNKNNVFENVEKEEKPELLDLGNFGLEVIGATQKELSIDLRDFCVKGTFSDETETKFVFRNMSLLDRANIGIYYRKALQGTNNPDLYTSDILWMYSTLLTVCTKKPEWFVLDQLPETAMPILRVLYEQFDKWVESFRRSDKGNSTKPE